jgi:hypothetical protein
VSSVVWMGRCSRVCRLLEASRRLRNRRRAASDAVFGSSPRPRQRANYAETLFLRGVRPVGWHRRSTSTGEAGVVGAASWLAPEKQASIPGYSVLGVRQRSPHAGTVLGSVWGSGAPGPMVEGADPPRCRTVGWQQEVEGLLIGFAQAEEKRRRRSRPSPGPWQAAPPRRCGPARSSRCPSALQSS